MWILYWLWWQNTELWETVSLEDEKKTTVSSLPCQEIQKLSELDLLPTKPCTIFSQRCQATKSWLAEMKSLKLAAKWSLEAKQEWVRILLLEGVLWIRREAGSAPTRQKSNIASNNCIWKQHTAQQVTRIGIFFLMIKKHHLKTG